MGNIGRALHAELAHGLEPDGFALVGDIGPGTALAISAVDDLVVDIGDVRDKAHLEPSPGEIAAEDVVDQGGPAMAQMGWPVDRGAAEIDADLAWLAQGEGSHALGGGVIEVQHSDKPTI